MASNLKMELGCSILGDRQGLLVPHCRLPCPLGRSSFPCCSCWATGSMAEGKQDLRSCQLGLRAAGVTSPTFTASFQPLAAWSGEGEEGMETSLGCLKGRYSGDISGRASGFGGFLRTGGGSLAPMPGVSQPPVSQLQGNRCLRPLQAAALTCTYIPICRHIHLHRTKNDTEKKPFFKKKKTLSREEARAGGSLEVQMANPVQG